MQLEMVPNHLPTPFPLVGKEDVPNYLDLWSVMTYGNNGLIVGTNNQYLLGK